MARALINNGMLEWAMARADMPVEALAGRVHVEPSQIERWLKGDDRPTFAQARKAATALAVPFGYLYLQRPPAEDETIPDLRTVGGERGRWDVNLRSLMTDILFKQEWYRDYRRQGGGEPFAFVGKFPLNAAAEDVAADMHSVILGAAGRPRAGTFEDYLQRLMLAAEDAGIWVMRTGIVGNNTHRPLSLSSFRGLAIADPLVPLVMINGQDSKAAQIFTLAHELAHIWLGESGVSNVQLGEDNYGAHRRVEQHCNKIAAEFLTPREEFTRFWRDGLGLRDQVDTLSRRFKVSRVVIARRAFDMGFVGRDEYSDFYAAEEKRWLDLNRDSGGDFFNTLPVRNGRRFTKSVISEAMRGTLLLRQASSLLGIQPGKIRKMHERLAS